MIQFQFYPYPRSKWWKWLMVYWKTDRSFYEVPVAPYYTEYYPIHDTIACIGPFQWRWTRSPPTRSQLDRMFNVKDK